MKPPVARNSSLFCASSRYVRAALLPSNTGSKRAACSARSSRTIDLAHSATEMSTTSSTMRRRRLLMSKRRQTLTGLGVALVKG